MRMRLVPVVMTCLAILAGGCGGSDSDATGDTSAATTAGTTAPAPATTAVTSTDDGESDVETGDVGQLADDITACLNSRGVGQAGRGPSQPTSERVLLTPGEPGEGAVIVEISRKERTATVIHLGVDRPLLDQVMGCVPPDQVKRRLTFDLFADDPDSQPVEYRP